MPTLRDLEHVAWRLHHLYRWPRPRRDALRGGTDAFDVYLAPTPPPFHVVAPDDPDIWEDLDRTSAFAIVAPGLPDACFRSAILAEAYARASMFDIDAGAQEGTANATAAFVASRAVHCPVSWLADLDDAQAAPQLAVSNTALGGGRGAVLFPWFLQDTRGFAGSVDLLHAIWELSAQKSPLEATQYVDEPDLLDVLARLQDDRTATLDALLLEYAIDRAFVGDRDDGLHLPETRYLGAAGAVRFDASVPWSALPRRVDSSAPIEPTGSSYVWLDLSSVPPDAALIVQARWELPTQFRFSFLRMDAAGSPLARIDTPPLQRENETQVTIENVGNAAGLLIVACNVGPNLSDLAFDPDATPYMASAYSLAMFPK
jgi:hypothetical protein